MGTCPVNGAKRGLGRVITLKLARRAPVVIGSGRGRPLGEHPEPSATSVDSNSCHTVAELLARPTHPTNFP
jgi:hypothetical protein